MIHELKPVSPHKLLDVKTGRIMTPEEARKDYDIRLVDPQVVNLARRLQEIRENGGQTKLEDFKNQSRKAREGGDKP